MKQPASVFGRYLTLCLTAIYCLQPSAADAGETPRPINACSFLDTKEIEAVLKVEVDPGERNDSGNVTSGEDVPSAAYSSTCLWRVAVKASSSAAPPASLDGANYVILTVMQWPVGSGGGKKFLQSFHDAAEAGDIDRQPIAVEIAEEGLWWGDGVAVSKGDRGFGISIHIVGERDREERLEETLARKIARRI